MDQTLKTIIDVLMTCLLAAMVAFAWMGVISIGVMLWRKRKS